MAGTVEDRGGGRGVGGGQEGNQVISSTAVLFIVYRRSNR